MRHLCGDQAQAATFSLMGSYRAQK
jgi:hypothetical protein